MPAGSAPGAAGARARLRGPRLLRGIRTARDWLGFAWNHRSPAARLRAQVAFLIRHQMAPPMRVDIDADPDALARLVARIEASWTAFGETDPHWSVLTNPAYRKARIGETSAAFYRTGAKDLDRVRSAFARAGEPFGTVRHMLDFGCGVGRISAAAAEAGIAVTGADISAAHLEVARAHCAGRGLAAEFVRIPRLAAIDELPETDLLYSGLVLQHNPPPVMAAILARALPRVRQGGFAWFQLPTYMAGYGYDLARDLATPAGKMEYHVLPQHAVFRLLHRAGFVPLEIRPSGAMASPGVESHVFFARRLGAPAPADPDRMPQGGQHG